MFVCACMHACMRACVRQTSAAVVTWYLHAVSYQFSLCSKWTFVVNSGIICHSPLRKLGGLLILRLVYRTSKQVVVRNLQEMANPASPGK